MKTTMFATEMVDPVMLFDIPGNPSTTASTITSTMTPTTRRMKEGMTGVNAPQVLFEVESVILLHLERLSLWTRDIAMSKLTPNEVGYRLALEILIQDAI